MVLAVALLSCNLMASGQHLLDESWADGDRTNQTLPGSAAWFSSLASHTLTVAAAGAGSMTQATPSTGVVIGYFTPSSPVVLQVGDTLRLTYVISFSGLVNPGSFIRLGLFDTSTRHRISADAAGTNNSAFVGAAGYIVEYGGTNQARVGNIRRREHDAASDNLITTTATAGNPYTNITSLKTGNTAFAEALADGILYTGVFEVARFSAERIDIKASLSRLDNIGGSVVLSDFTCGNENAARLYHAFDMIGFAVAGSAADSCTLHVVNLNWSGADTTPPLPDPMTWAIAPAPVNSTQIAMTASTAEDAEFDVEYLFVNITAPSRSSGWQSHSDWTDTGLADNTEYVYRVKARDTSANRNETNWSAPAAVRTPVEWDINPPAPDPMTWKNKPAMIGYNAVTMTATAATDAEGNTPVQYYFANLTDPSRDSGWQTETTYLDRGLLYNTEYSYRVKAHDSSAHYNETQWSSVVTVATADEPVLLPYLRKSLFWHFPSLGIDVPVHIYFKHAAAPKPRPVVVYVKNHGFPRIGQEPDASILSDFLDEELIILTLDFGSHPDAVSPVFDADLQAFFKAVYGYQIASLLADAGLVPEQYLCWFVPAGCRLARDLVYFELDKHGSWGTKEQVMVRWNTTLLNQGKVSHTVSAPDQMHNPDGSPLDWKLRMDIIYPSQPSRKLPLVFWNGTGSQRNMLIGPSYYRPHFAGLVMRGFAYAHIDHCYNPLARHWAYNHFEPGYTLEDWNGLKSNTAAIRFLRQHADLYGIDANNIAGWGHSKGSYGITRLSDPEHESQGEHSVFSGFPAGTPQPQPWQGYSSKITASYQSMGSGTRRTQYVTARNVPTVIACGRFDQYDHWSVFPPLVNAYETQNANHLAFWMEALGHDLPRDHDPVLDINRYEMSLKFFDQYLKPDQHPEVLYILPKNGRDNVSGKGLSQAISDAHILPANALNYVSYETPITVHFGQPMNAESLFAGGLQVVRITDGVPLAGRWTALRGDTVFRFLPAKYLRSENRYRVTVTTQAVNQQGKAILEERSVEFKTGEVDEEAICVDRPRNDLDGDCVVNLSDFALLAEHWLWSGWYP